MCYITESEEEHAYVTMRDAADDLWGRERLKSFPLRGRGSFPHKSQHLPLLAGGMSLFHYLLALSCDCRALSLTRSAGLSFSLALHLFPPLRYHSTPCFRSITLMQCVSVCRCLLWRGSNNLTRTNAYTVSFSPSRIQPLMSARFI